MIVWLAALQLAGAAFVARVLCRSFARERIRRCDEPTPDRVSVILPLLNEAQRAPDCLEALIAQPPELEEILAVDGGSSDGTRAIIAEYGARDSRVRLIDAAPIADGWTGKAWGLHVGLLHVNPVCRWVLCIDADVRVSPYLVRSLLAHARRTGVSSFSVATLQSPGDAMSAMLHPSLLATLIYRYGIPGTATRDPHRVQANGQCFISPRETLIRTSAIAAARSSLCEDVTIARRLAQCGEAVGFYESDRLAVTTMYADWRETWSNWPRSLPMRDQYFGWREFWGLAQLLLVQALPLPLLFMGAALRAPRWFLTINATLFVLRLGVLFGAARAYDSRPWTYWFSPLCDLPVALKLIGSALARRQYWRGRTYVRARGGVFASSGAIAVGESRFRRAMKDAQSGTRAKAASMRLIARVLAAPWLDVRATGIENVPTVGPALLAARHYHHWFDGLALLISIPRPVHILVAVDWARTERTRRLVELLATLADWPVVLRRDALARNALPGGRPPAFFVPLAIRYERKALRDSLRLLGEGRLLVVFPEGYPNIDPHFTPKIGPEEFLPFKPGFSTIASALARRRVTVPIVPVGARYERARRWKVDLRFGEPVYAHAFESRAALVRHVEREVRKLSSEPVSLADRRSPRAAARTV